MGEGAVTVSSLSSFPAPQRRTLSCQWGFVFAQQPSPAEGHGELWHLTYFLGGDHEGGRKSLVSVLRNILNNSFRKCRRGIYNERGMSLILVSAFKHVRVHLDLKKNIA